MIPNLQSGSTSLQGGAPGLSDGRVWPALRNGAGALVGWPIVALVRVLSGLTGNLVHWALVGIVLIEIPIRFERPFAERLEAAEFGGIAGFAISPTTLALCALYARWAILILTARTSHAAVQAPGRISRPLIAYLGFTVLSTMAAVDVGLSLRELFVFLQAFLIYFYLVTWIRTREEVGFVMVVMMAGLAIESLAMFYGLHVGETTSLPGLRKIQVNSDATDGWARVGGTIGSPNTAASYLTLLMAPTLAILITRARLLWKLVAIGSAGLAAGALVVTQSRGGWIAAALSLGIFWVATARPNAKWLGVTAAGACLLSLVLFFSLDVIQGRISGDDQGSAESRGPLMETALKIIQDYPIFGIGPNNYGTVMKRYGAVYGQWGDWVYTVHNKFLLVWSETGPGGLLAFMWLLMATIRLAWKGWTAADPWLSPLALGFTGAIVGHVVHLQVDLFNARPFVEMLFVIVAIVQVIHTLTRPSTPLVPDLRAQARPA